MSISLGINALAGAIVPHRGKLWQALNLANRPIDDIGEFKFGDLNAVRHTRTCVNCYWWVLMAKLKTSPTFPAIRYMNNENNDVTCCILCLRVHVSLEFQPLHKGAGTPRYLFCANSQNHSVVSRVRFTA